MFHISEGLIRLICGGVLTKIKSWKLVKNACFTGVTFEYILLFLALIIVNDDATFANEKTVKKCYTSVTTIKM